MSVCKKPLFWGILLAVLLCAVLALCFLLLPRNAQLKPLPCTYQFETEDFGETASVTLSEDGTFTLSPSPLSSYIGIGRYTVEGNRLTLTVDANEIYVFTVRKDTLVFDGKNSVYAKRYGGAFTDGAVFH